MSTKRHRTTNTGDAGNARVKRAKFSLDSVYLPNITTNGVVFVTGAGDFGQLGLGPDILEKNRPALINLDHEIVDICAGGMHTVCLTNEGKVITFGCNDEGALGRVTSDKEEAEFLPDLVELPGKVIQISAGDSHTAALLDDGRVFAWGTFRDSHGNMGLTSAGNKKSPYEIFSGHIVMKIASGADHIVFLTKEGEIYTCGCGEQGQLGRTSARTSGRTARNGIGNDQLEKLLVPSKINLKVSLRLHFDNIWAGTYATFAKVANKDDIYVFGLNNYNQIGLPETVPQFLPKLSQDFSKYKWESICSAQHHTVGLTKDGKVYVIGRKDYGRLGLGKDCEDAAELVEVDFFKKMKVTNIGCGSATSFAALKDGKLYGWGMGTVGQIGTGDEEDCLEPTLIKSKQLGTRKVFRVASGGQHTVILAMADNNNKGEDEKDNES